MLLSGCVNNDETDTAEGSYCLLINSPVTLFENQDITITITSSVQLSDTEFRLYFEAVNKTDEVYDFYFLPIRINSTGVFVGGDSYLIPSAMIDEPHEFGFDIDYESEDIPENSNGTHTLSFLFALGEDEDEVENKFDVATISKGNLYTDISLPDNYLIGSDEYFDVYYISAERIERTSSLTHFLLFYNKSNKSLFYDLEFLALNNISIDTYSHFLIEPESYFYYINTNYTLSLSNVNSNKDIECIEVDFRAYEDNKDEVLSLIQSKLVINDNIELAPPKIKGDVIYSENDIIISVETVYIGFEPDDQDYALLYWNIYNYGDNSCNIRVENFITDYKYGDFFKDHEMYFSALPNAFRRTQFLGANYILLDGEQYFMTADYIFYNDAGEEIQKETLTFTVK